MITVPELERHCGSWTIVDRRNGLPVGELFERKNVDVLAKHGRPDVVEILTTLQWLTRLNLAVKLAGGVQPTLEHLTEAAKLISEKG